MGITIHFQGRLRRAGDAAKLVDEVADIARTLKWAYRLHDGDLTGITFVPHARAEEVSLLFDPDGFLRNPVCTHEDESRMCFVRTQLAPPEVHIALVKLFRHLQKRYFAEFVVIDEGDFWRTGDAARLLEKRGSIDRPPEASPSGEPPDDMAEKIDECLSSFPDVEDDVAEPGLGAVPDRSELVSWGVEEWVRYFDGQDRLLSPLLAATAPTEDSEQGFADALLQAERREEEFERTRRSLEEALRGRTPAEPGLEPPAAETLPPLDRAGGTAFPAIPNWEKTRAACPAFRDALEFQHLLFARAGGRSPFPPVLHYIVALITSTLLGVPNGHHWSDEEGFPHARTARYMLAVDRFDRIARLLRKFRHLGLEDLADRAGRIAAGFREACSG